MTLKEIHEKINKIEGWFYDYQVNFLYPYACENRGKRIVEIGTYAGKSTLFWVLCDPDCQVITIDKCIGDPIVDVPEGTSIDLEVVKQGNILSIHEDCNDLAPRFNLPIDFLFIDGGHDYESICKDIDTWVPKVKGYVLIHDYNDGWHEVKRAVDEKIRGKYEIITDELDMFMFKV